MWPPRTRGTIPARVSGSVEVFRRMGVFSRRNAAPAGAERKSDRMNTSRHPPAGTMIDPRAQAWLALPRIAMAVGALVIGTAATLPAAKEPETLPVVVDASVPFYPPVLSKAHIEGVIRLRVTTDGTRASSVEILDGQPMLARAASDNIKTWKFEQHQPRTFETTFRYRVLPVECDSDCRCASVERPAVVLHLPTEVEVSDEEGICCDPVTAGCTACRRAREHCSPVTWMMSNSPGSICDAASHSSATRFALMTARAMCSTSTAAS